MEAQPPGLVNRRENLFADGGFAGVLEQHGLAPRLRATPGLRAFAHSGSEDRFLFFFGLAEGAGEHAVELDGVRIELALGPKTCGVLRFTGGELVAWYVKGENEVEGVVPEVHVASPTRRLSLRGDGSSVD